MGKKRCHLALTEEIAEVDEELRNGLNNAAKVKYDKDLAETQEEQTIREEILTSYLVGAMADNPVAKGILTQAKHKDYTARQFIKIFHNLI